MQTRYKPLKAEFDFASFTFPKYAWTLPPRNLQKRLERYKLAITGDYYLAPKPEQAGKGASFYLSSDFMPSLRWQWCDEVEDTRIDHTGWYADAYHDSKIRGFIMRLPRSRGFLAGWSMGESMFSFVECDIYPTATAAAYAADSLAEAAAEQEREFQEEQEREREEAEERQTAATLEAAFAF